MEPGAPSSAPPNPDLPPLKERGIKPNDLQKWRLQAFHNRKPGLVLPSHAIDNLTPRKEFLTSECSFGRTPTNVSSQAYLDTLSSFSFVTPQLLQKVQQANAQGITWKTTNEFVEFRAAVGKETHKAPIVRLQLAMDSFRVWHDFGIAPIQDFECILGSEFTNSYLQVLNWQQRNMILHDSAG